MKYSARLSTRALAWLVGASLVPVCFAAESASGHARVQTLELRRGWNSVFLEVSPVDGFPDVVFAGLPVDTVAVYLPPLTPLQFLVNPGEETWKRPGWAVWYAPGRPEAAFSNLVHIAGNRPYLIHATADTVWAVEGWVTHASGAWQPNSLNFVGFGIDDVRPPTFAEFFAGARAHAEARFYRLVDGLWQKVVDPQTATMRSGEAYWIGCRSRSYHRGPLMVQAGGRHGLELGQGLDTSILSLFNTSLETVDAVLELRSADSIPVQIVERNPATLVESYLELPANGYPVVIEAGRRRDIRLHLRSEAMTEASQSDLLKLTTSVGTVHWIPLSAKRLQ